ncbi:LOW QUALITY PROTEIN: hypothetical protein Cgig2_001658 [Carnegiea gigantea]|uniref:Uncharacterized protein n=1 Tax=Carnegiea gigantea TaxID=171969 RepID=A0A9Q1JRP7_9CARY|nr:LOW QUALITY PROTEIN: hypothetical protein Cgig2_001658 [Carnegiea gigantea]
MWAQPGRLTGQPVSTLNGWDSSRSSPRHNTSADRPSALLRSSRLQLLDSCSEPQTSQSTARCWRSPDSKAVALLDPSSPYNIVGKLFFSCFVEGAMDIERQGTEIHANEILNFISTITALHTLVEDDKKKKFGMFFVIDGTNFSDGKCKKTTFIAIAQYGTSNMKKHLETCKAYQAAKSTEGGGEKRILDWVSWMDLMQDARYSFMNLLQGFSLSSICEDLLNWLATMERPGAVEEVATTPGAGIEECWFDNDAA